MNVSIIGTTKCEIGPTENPERLLEYAGRCCYRGALGDNPGKFLQARIRDGHESIIEHASITFYITDISRACSHQLVRHRLASYSQESQRYVDMSIPDFITPPSIAQNQRAGAIWSEMQRQVAYNYRHLLELGIPKEDARFVLPNATATRIIVTMNARELRSMFRTRIDPHAQWEIQELAVRMLVLSSLIMPNVFCDLMEELKRKYPSFFVGIE